MGKSLGDRIISQAIIDRYVADNPDENLIILNSIENYDEIIKTKHPVKIFLCDIGNINWFPGAFWFSITNESKALASQGWYSRLPSDIKIDAGKKELTSKNLLENTDIAQLQKWVIMHLRNIPKQQEKNIAPHYALEILKLLDAFHKKKIIKGTAIVGNDEASDGLRMQDFQFMIGESMPILDLRNRLSLSEIAWLCNQAGLYIGSDSGIAHVAGASRCRKLVVWGYDSERWFPIVAPDQKMIARKKQESSLDRILNDIVSMLKIEKK